MKYWEFLIQKEGDQAWLPLETQQVDILEGRYRIVAHTNRTNAPLEVRLSQLLDDKLLDDTTPPRKRVHKRIGQTDEAGLIVVMPLTHLQPGTWELQCSSRNVMDDLIGEGWQYRVELEVFGAAEADWPSHWPAVANDDAALQAHGSLLSTVIEETGDAVVCRQIDSPLIQAQAELAQLHGSGQIQAAADSGNGSLILPVGAAYRVSLRQQAYLARPSEPMTIIGKVSPLAPLAAEEPTEADSQLWIRLQNPETAQVIMEAHRPLSLARLPADFKVQIQLPAEMTTRVILGEVSLRKASVESEAVSQVLASTAFTITAGIAQLLDVIANQDPGKFEEEVSLMAAKGANAPAIATEQTAEQAAIGPDSPLAVAGLDPTRRDVSPAVGVVLPPRLSQPLSQPLAHSTPHAAAPELPTFESQAADARLHISDGANGHRNPPAPSAPPIQLPPMVAQPAQFVGTSIEDDDLEADEVAAALEDIDQQLMESSSELDALEPPGIEGLMPGPPPIRSPLPVAEVNLASPAAIPSLEELTTEQLEAEHLKTGHLDSSGYRPTASSEVMAADHMAVSQNGTQETSTVHQSTIHQSTVHQSTEAATDDRPEDYRQAHAQQPLERQQLLAKQQTPNRQPSNRQPSSRQPSSRQVEAALDFQSLKLKDHFWQRLSTLTHECHQEAAELAERMKDAGVSRDGGAFSGNRPRDLPTALDLEDTSEVVIYDDQPPAQAPPADPETYRANEAARFDRPFPKPPLPKIGQAAGSASAFSGPAISGRDNRPSHQFSRSLSSPSQAGDYAQPVSAEVVPTPETLPEMALPVISAPMGELIAGEIITVTVRTRPSVYKPFIKLWVIDRQSRSLVGEPQLLTNLLPDALGDLQATAKLQVPMDCLDIQIAAIAVDMATQQESGKAVVNRHVVPADAPPGPPYPYR